MAVKILDTCISCGACESECPNEAISAGDSTYVVEADKCTECYGFYGESQCQSVCPTEAIVLDTDSPESVEQLLAKFQTIHPGKAAAHADSWKRPA